MLFSVMSIKDDGAGRGMAFRPACWMRGGNRELPWSHHGITMESGGSHQGIKSGDEMNISRKVGRILNKNTYLCNNFAKYQLY